MLKRLVFGSYKGKSWNSPLCHVIFLNITSLCLSLLTACFPWCFSLLKSSEYGFCFVLFCFISHFLAVFSRSQYYRWLGNCGLRSPRGLIWRGREKKPQYFIAYLKLLSDDRDSFRGPEETCRLLSGHSLGVGGGVGEFDAINWWRKVDHVLPSMGGSVKHQCFKSWQFLMSIAFITILLEGQLKVNFTYPPISYFPGSLGFKLKHLVAGNDLSFTLMRLLC